MSGILIAILVISATAFTFGYITALKKEEERVPVATGVILTLVLWKEFLALAIIVMIFSAFGLFINSIKMNINE